MYLSTSYILILFTFLFFKINGEDVIEGQLRIYWQVTIPIQLKQCDDVPVPPIASWRHSYYAAIGNGFEVDNSNLKVNISLLFLFCFLPYYLVLALLVLPFAILL